MRIKNWDKYQHYKHKSDMKWFKLYGRDLLNDADFMMLDDQKQATLIKLWCLASESQGRLPQVSEIAFRLRKSIDFINKSLIDLDKWVTDVESLDKVYTKSITDKIREDKIRLDNKNRSVFFNTFWEAYPSSVRKVNKIGCLKKWEAKDLDSIHDKIINHVNMMKKSEQWTKSKGDFIPLPMTYLNQERWDMDITPTRKVWEGGI